PAGRARPAGGSAGSADDPGGTDRPGSVAFDLDGMGGQQGQRQRLAAQDIGPQVGAGGGDGGVGQGRQDHPVVVVEFALELPERPAGIAREDTDALDQRRDLLGIGGQVDQYHPAVDAAQAGHAGGGGADAENAQAEGGVTLDRAADVQGGRLGGQRRPAGQHL